MAKAVTKVAHAPSPCNARAAIITCQLLVFAASRPPSANKKIRVTGSLRCNSGLGLVDAALKGLGVVQLPDYYLQKHIESGRLEKLLVKHEPLQEGIWAVFPQNKYLATKVRLLIDFLADHLE